MALNGPHQYCMVLVCPIVPDYKAIGPLFAAKMGEIDPQMAKILLGPPNGPQIAQNGHQRTLKGPQRLVCPVPL